MSEPGFVRAECDAIRLRVANLEQLERAALLGRAVADATSDAVLVVDDTGTYVDANPAACVLFGLPKEGLVGRKVADLVPAEYAFSTWGDRVNKGARGHFYVVRSDGATRKVDCQAIAHFAPGLHLSILRDVTEREEAEPRQGETDAAPRRFEEQLSQARKMEAMGKLAGGVAHDFNNLLSVIVSYSDLLLGSISQDDPIRSDIDEVRRAAGRAGELTRQLLAFSRKQILQPVVLNVNNVVQGIERMLRRTLGEDIEFTLLLGHGLGAVRADPTQIEQVILDLVVNARDAMPSGGKLSIETANVELDTACAGAHLGVTPGAYVLLAVTDTGLGMDADTQERIFEPFFTTKEKAKGTGLGLSTVFGIVKQSGGHIWVYSEIGRGSSFKVYLPRTDAAPQVESLSMPTSRFRPGSGS